MDAGDENTSASAQPLRLTVKTADEQVYQLLFEDVVISSDLSANAIALQSVKVLDIKRKLEELILVSPQRMRLIYAGAQLRDDDPLYDVQISNGSVLHLVLRPLDDEIAEPVYSSVSLGRMPSLEALLGATDLQLADIERLVTRAEGRTADYMAAGEALRTGQPIPSRSPLRDLAAFRGGTSDERASAEQGTTTASPTASSTVGSHRPSPSPRPLGGRSVMGLSAVDVAALGVGSAGEGVLGGGGSAGISSMFAARTPRAEPIVGPGALLIGRPGERVVPFDVQLRRISSDQGVSRDAQTSPSTDQAPGQQSSAVASLAGLTLTAMQPCISPLTSIVQSLHTVRTVAVAMGWAQGNASAHNAPGVADSQTESLELAPSTEAVERRFEYGSPTPSVLASRMSRGLASASASTAIDASASVAAGSSARQQAAEGATALPDLVASHAQALEQGRRESDERAGSSASAANRQPEASLESTPIVHTVTDVQTQAEPAASRSTTAPLLSSASMAASAAASDMSMSLSSSSSGTEQSTTAAVTLRTRRYFSVGQWVDVLDTVDQWLEATILRIRGEYVYVHYNGWPERWDEWLHVCSPRLAPFRTRTQHATLAMGLCPWPVNLLPSAPVMAFPPAMLSAAQGSAVPQVVEGPGLGNATAAATTTSSAPEDSTLNPITQTDHIHSTGTCEFGVSGSRAVTVRCGPGDPRPIFAPVMDSVQVCLALLSRLNELATEQVRREARRAALLSGTPTSALYGSMQDDRAAAVQRPDSAGLPAERVQAARLADYQQSLDDRTEIAALSQQLSPLLDRVGRVLTDLAPHVEALGRSPAFVSAETTIHAWPVPVPPGSGAGPGNNGQAARASGSERTNVRYLTSPVLVRRTPEDPSIAESPPSSASTAQVNGVDAGAPTAAVVAAPASSAAGGMSLLSSRLYGTGLLQARQGQGLYARVIAGPAQWDAERAGYTALTRAPVTVALDADIQAVRQPGYSLRAGDGSLSLLNQPARPASVLPSVLPQLLQLSHAVTAASAAVHSSPRRSPARSPPLRSVGSPAMRGSAGVGSPALRAAVGGSPGSGAGGGGVLSLGVSRARSSPRESPGRSGRALLPLRLDEDVDESGPVPNNGADATEAEGGHGQSEGRVEGSSDGEAAAEAEGEGEGEVHEEGEEGREELEESLSHALSSLSTPALGVLASTLEALTELQMSADE